MSTIIASHAHENDYGMGISAFRVCVCEHVVYFMVPVWEV